MIVCSRWAIVMTVESWNWVRRECWISVSVLWSDRNPALGEIMEELSRVHKPIEAVASSRMRIRLRRTSARASAIICRCPSEKLPPELLTVVSKDTLSSSAKSSWRLKRPAERKASLSSMSSCSANGSRFSRTDPDCDIYLSIRIWWQKKQLYTISSGCWGMIVTLPRSDSKLRVLVGRPSKYTSPSVGIKRRRLSVNELFPDPVRPTVKSVISMHYSITKALSWPHRFQFSRPTEPKTISCVVHWVHQSCISHTDFSQTGFHWLARQLAAFQILSPTLPVQSRCIAGFFRGWKCFVNDKCGSWFATRAHLFPVVKGEKQYSRWDVNMTEPSTSTSFRFRILSTFT